MWTCVLTYGNCDSCEMEDVPDKSDECSEETSNSPGPRAAPGESRAPCLYDLVLTQPADSHFHWYVNTPRRRMSLIATCLGLGPCHKCGTRLIPRGVQFRMLYGGET